MISPTDTIYPVLTENIAPHELSSCFLVSEEEIKFAENETRQISAKLGFLLMLKSFQNLGYFITTKNIPEKILIFVSNQLNIDNPSILLIDYDTSRNRFAHLDKILKYLNVKDYSKCGDEIVEKSARQAALIRENLTDIINVCIENLLRERTELPAFSRLYREAMGQRSTAYINIYSKIFTDIGDVKRSTIQELFQVDPMTRKSQWDQVKFEIGAPKKREIDKLIKHIEWLRKIGNFDCYLQNIPPARLEQMSIEAMALDAYEMTELEQKKRFSIAVALITNRKSKSIDVLVNIFLKQMSYVFYSAKTELEKYLRENQDKSDEIMRRFISVEDIVNDISSTEKK